MVICETRPAVQSTAGFSGLCAGEPSSVFFFKIFFMADSCHFSLHFMRLLGTFAFEFVESRWSSG